MMQVIVPTLKEVWYGVAGDDRVTYDPDQVQYISGDHYKLIDPAVHIGTAVWQGEDCWWYQPILLELTIVRGRIVKRTAPYLDGKPSWWVDDLESVTYNLQLGGA